MSTQEITPTLPALSLHLHISSFILILTTFVLEILRCRVQLFHVFLRGLWIIWKAFVKNVQWNECWDDVEMVPEPLLFKRPWQISPSSDSSSFPMFPALPLSPPPEFSECVHSIATVPSTLCCSLFNFANSSVECLQHLGGCQNCQEQAVKWTCSLSHTLLGFASVFSPHFHQHNRPLFCPPYPLGLSFSSLTILFSYLLFTCTVTHMISRDRWKNRIEGSQSPSSINRTQWSWVGSFCLGHWRNLTPVGRITNTRQKLS